MAYLQGRTVSFRGVYHHSKFFFHQNSTFYCTWRLFVRLEKNSTSIQTKKKHAKTPPHFFPRNNKKNNTNTNTMCHEDQATTPPPRGGQKLTEDVPISGSFVGSQVKTTTGFRRVPTISIDLVVQRRVKPCYGLSPEDHSAVIPRRTHNATWVKLENFWLS